MAFVLKIRDEPSYSEKFTLPLCITVMNASPLGLMMDRFLKDPTFTGKATELG